MKTLFPLLSLSSVWFVSAQAEATGAQPAAPAPVARPNIIYILADDLGIGELGCYGQTRIRTPNIDRLAAEGMKFTRHYSGAAVSAPSRCTLLTGLHTGHAFIRENREIKGGDGQLPIPAGTVTVAKLLKAAGYATAVIGKWGLGPITSEGAPLKQGFAHSFGPNCQRVAHSYYPATTICDDREITLNAGCAVPGHARFPKGANPGDPASYRKFIGKDYVPDLLEKDAIAWIRAHKDGPFFLYFATPVPHMALQVPEDSLAEYKDKFNDTPYLGDKGYLPCRYPRATYAAMITRMDRSIGRMLDLLKELNLDDNTMVMFCSDNGPTYNGGTDSVFFGSAAGRRGLKGAFLEGGIRAPFVARWPGKIQPGTVTGHLSAMWDFLPTACDLAGVKIPEGIDGISLLPTLLGQSGQKAHDDLYWENGRTQALLTDDGWKGLQSPASRGFALYNIKDDPAEKRDLAKDNPEIVAKIRKRMAESHTDNPRFPLAGETAGNSRK